MKLGIMRRRNDDSIATKNLPLTFSVVLEIMMKHCWWLLFIGTPCSHDDDDDDDATSPVSYFIYSQYGLLSIMLRTVMCAVTCAYENDMSI